jgi:DNA polymerase-3 subunit beta
MNFTVSRDSLFKALQKVINVIPSKTTIDILYNILLNTEDGKLKIVATDLEITQISWCDCQVEESGSIVLPGKLLMDILREMPNTDLTFNVDSNFKISLSSQFGQYKISGQNINDYPNIPSLETEDTIKVKNEYLKRMIEKTLYACSTDNLRPALTGVFCQIFNDNIRMVSTDGHRLVKISNSDFNSPNVQRELIIPTRALNLVARNISDKGEQEIILGKNHVLFKFGDTLLYSRIINEPYPDYERVIPQNNTKELAVKRDMLVASVKRVSLFSNPISYQVKLRIGENKIDIFAQDIDFGGEAHESLSCNYSSSELEIAYNANYLLDTLRHIGTEEIRISLESSDGPGLVFPQEQKDNEELLMLIMPVRLSG